MSLFRITRSIELWRWATVVIAVLMLGSVNLWGQEAETATAESEQTPATEGLSQEGEGDAANQSGESTEDGEASGEGGQAEESEEGEKESEPPPPPPPPILQPYVVDIELTCRTSPLLSAQAQQELALSVQQQLQRRFHQMWVPSVQIETSDEALYAAEIESLTDAESLVRFGESEADKVFVVSVSPERSWTDCVCREWDPVSRTIGPPMRKRIFDRRTLAPQVADAICEAFRPVAELEVLEEGKIEFLIRAGEYPPRDPDQTLFQPGDYLVPFMRYLDRSREVRSIQPIPWTYLKVDSVDRRRMQLTMTSVFRAPIPTSRRRVQVMAMRVRPYFPNTEVKIFPRGEPRNPLVGVRTELMNRMPTEEDKVEDRIKLSTNRRGYITVPVDPENPLQYLYVYSGQSLLARVPMLPGTVPEVEIEVPDDSARLHVEGEVALLQGELIDTVATREVIMARIRAAANANKWDDVDRFLEDLDDLRTLDQFLATIDTLQVQAVYHAKQKKDRVAESRVKKLASGIRDSATKYLDPFRITDFKREIAAMRPN